LATSGDFQLAIDMTCGNRRSFAGAALLSTHAWVGVGAIPVSANMSPLP
jgi:hypothetical protein